MCWTQKVSKIAFVQNGVVQEAQVQLNVIYKYAVKLGAKHVEIAGILPNCCSFSSETIK